mmetsp:Transcript_15140/g.38423  ORF Transcript_15140/g.38423 Transcript_15140/m.38423 type:complete len:269 (+) Transcript_15140:344-1150(+)
MPPWQQNLLGSHASQSLQMLSTKSASCELRHPRGTWRGMCREESCSTRRGKCSTSRRWPCRRSSPETQVPANSLMRRARFAAWPERQRLQTQRGRSWWERAGTAGRWPSWWPPRARRKRAMLSCWPPLARRPGSCGRPWRRPHQGSRGMPKISGRQGKRLRNSLGRLRRPMRQQPRLRRPRRWQQQARSRHWLQGWHCGRRPQVSCKMPSLKTPPMLPTLHLQKGIFVSLRTGKTSFVSASGLQRSGSRVSRSSRRAAYARRTKGHGL